MLYIIEFPITLQSYCGVAFHDTWYLTSHNPEASPINTQEILMNRKDMWHSGSAAIIRITPAKSTTIGLWSRTSWRWSGMVIVDLGNEGGSFIFCGTFFPMQICPFFHLGYSVHIMCVFCFFFKLILEILELHVHLIRKKCLSWMGSLLV